MLLPALAEKILREVRGVLKEEIIVVNTDGIIVSSTSPDRVGAFHEGALQSVKKRDKRIITADDEKKLKGVKAGINLPVFFQKEVAAVIGITGDPEKVAPYGEIIRKMTELLISENFYSEQIDWQSRALEGFVFDWLQERGHGSSFIDRALMLKVDTRLDRLVFIAEFLEPEKIPSREIWQRLLSWPEKNSNDLFIRWGHDRIVALFAHHSEEHIQRLEDRVSRYYSYLDRSSGSPLSGGAGQPAASSALSRSFRQAERAVKAAKKARGLRFDKNLTLEMLMDEIKPETKLDYIKRTIGPLQQHPDVLATLKELFRQNHSLKKTAESMHIHINTLHYRLRKIEDLTGLGTGNAQQLFILYMACLLLDEHTNNH
ncbi:CdaR family transcriptional regulator [Bacillus infantis]|uniref:CdaR family transcriptional regulator n=1 Tax=Bacillus infantis TaxID=324767 RepID=UPI001CD7B2A8|nr:sugar diacid recognition domain-containing protein [Bacillus infantis]MCA1034431.1 helix-turn-helix domain-containing protein [Bacillus infantis]